MDSSSFDRLSRRCAVAASRRVLAGALLGTAVALLGLDEAAAAPCPKGRKRCKKKCIPRKKCCTNAHCRPKSTGRICKGGRCVCPPARPRNCQGRCIPWNQCCVDADCGGPVQNGVTVCRNGGCVVQCDANFADCDGIRNTGCEANLRQSVEHCGRCNRRCPAQPDVDVTCFAGTCRHHRFITTPGTYTFTIPAAGTLSVDASGGRGGNGAAGQAFVQNDGGAGGDGALGTRVAVAGLPVTAGQLVVTVGGAGDDAIGQTGGGAGFGAESGSDGSPGNGGGHGGGGGGGGGTSSVSKDDTVLVAASGGGGGGGGGGARSTESHAGGVGGAGGDSNNGELDGGTGGGGGPGGSGIIGPDGEPGESGSLGEGMPGPRVLENDGPGQVRVTWAEA